MAVQDMRRGKGICVLDPKGDLADRVLDAVPQNRVNDAIFLDLAKPVPIDIMSCASSEEMHPLAADLMHTFIQLTASKEEGEQWTPILRHAVYALLEAGNCAFTDIHEILKNESRRKQICAKLKDPLKKDFWAEFPKIPQKAYEPIINRMNKYMLIEPARTILQEPDARLRISDVVESGKVLIVKLCGAGNEAANLIGTILVAKIMQAAFRRQRTSAESDRKPFHLYADEFQRFQTSDFATILSEAGGMQLCLTLANQFDEQLDQRIFAAITGNSPSYVCFTLGPKTAGQLRPVFGSDAMAEAVNLPAWKALYRDANGKTDIISTPPPYFAPQSYADQIRKRTFEQYAGQPPRAAAAGVESKPDEPGPKKPFPTNDGKTSGPKRPS
jgi:hypothetical protein